MPNGTTVFATLLTYPFPEEIVALPAAQRPNILARIADVVEPVVSTSLTIRESSLSNETETSKLTRFVAAMLAANRFLLDPAIKTVY